MAVLVVDDDATVVNLVTAVLHRAGIDAEVALDGPGALQRLGRGRYRAVLSDLTMPGMSGLQLLREARARGHELPFLIMTAYLPPETEAAMRSEPGVAGVLRKPFDIKRLVDEVRSLLHLAGPVSAVAEVAAAVAFVDDRAGHAPSETPEDAAVEVAAEVAAELAAEVRAEVETVDVAAAVAEVSTVVVEEIIEAVEDRVADPVAEEVADEFTADFATAVDANAPATREPVLVSALLPLSLMEFVSARMRRQALIAQAERRAAALLARPAPIVRTAEPRRGIEPLREAEQGC